jgi:hypothetical protein
MKKSWVRASGSAAVVLAMGACGAPSTGSSTLSPQPDGREQPSQVGDFATVRPFDSLNRYLGIYLSAEARLRIDEAARSAGQACSAPGNAFQPPSISDRDMLKATDLGAYRRQFGYGVVASEMDQAAGSNKKDTAPPSARDGLLPKPEEMEAVTRCEEIIGVAMEKHMAPLGVNQRADELLSTLLSSPDMINASDRWRACMAIEGHVTEEDPMNSQVIVEGALLAAIGRHQNRSGTGDSEELLVALPENEEATLLSYEQSVFAADTVCLGSSGAGNALLAIEKQVLNDLRKAFPAFDGVS